MAYTLKLNIYNFSLYRITRIENGRRVGGVIKPKYITEERATPFPVFARTLNAGINRINYLTTIFQSLVSFFDGKFKVNNEFTKAVSITDNPQPILATLRYTIDGLFKGGDTGIGKVIYTQENATEPGATINNTDVPVNNYFYKIWMPYDGDDGILMIQSYTDMGCTATFKDQIEEYFIARGFKPQWNCMIPSGFIDEYLNRSFIKEIKVIYKREERGGADSFYSLRRAQKVSTLKNLNIQLSRLLDLPNYRQRLTEEIINTIDFDPDNDLAKVFYVDENGKKASATIDNLETIFPSIILPESLKNRETEEAELEPMATFTNGILEQIKTQIEYNVTPIE